ncbi:MAG: hydroxymethylpyrimidine/phosphomethylpyrimidine kinase [Mogibacterium diversum]|nr:hydroxymethylpyrimidine/phosphomethylpyrimidine kinase [Mogibacterium diversum]
MKIPTVLSIAGSDPSGGAGIQGDIKTIFAEGCYGMGVVTGLTVQNTLGVSDVMPVPTEFLYRQIDEVIYDIKPEATKIGMIVSAEQVDVIVGLIKRHSLENVIVDPVIAPTSGAAFASEEVMKSMIENLFPLSTLVTPNLPEAKRICEIIGCQNLQLKDDAQKQYQAQVQSKDISRIKIQSQSKPQSQTEIYGNAANLSAPKLACFIGQRCGCNVLIKGGHAEGSSATDYLWTASDENMMGCTTEFMGDRVETTSSHGTGCALSSSIAANMAKGHTLEAAIEIGKEYVTTALKSDMRIGTGNCSIDHGALVRQ